MLNALNSEDRGLKVLFSLAMIVVETFELILCQMLSSQGKNAPSVRLATSRENGSGGSGSAFGFRKSGSDGSGFRFRFGS